MMKRILFCFVCIFICVSLIGCPSPKVEAPTERQIKQVESSPADDFARGVALYNQRNYPEAIKAFADVVRKDPKNYKAYLNLAAIQLKLENVIEALSY
jgi:Tfp pilus assembly protein PilF